MAEPELKAIGFELEAEPVAPPAGGGDVPIIAIPGGRLALSRGVIDDYVLSASAFLHLGFTGSVIPQDTKGITIRPTDGTINVKQDAAATPFLPFDSANGDVALVAVDGPGVNNIYILLGTATTVHVQAWA